MMMLESSDGITVVVSGACEVEEGSSKSSVKDFAAFSELAERCCCGSSRGMIWSRDVCASELRDIELDSDRISGDISLNDTVKDVSVTGVWWLDDRVDASSDSIVD